MTDYSKVTINDIWQKRKLKSFNKVSSNYDLSDEGNGIYIQTLSGDTLFDLRPASERLFLGHLHPLLLKAKSQTNSVKFSTATELPEAFKGKAVEVSAADLILGKNLASISEQSIVVERDMGLFARSGLFYFLENQFYKRVIFSEPLGVYAWEQENSSPCFEASLLHHTDELLQNYFQAQGHGKNDKDTKLLKSFKNEFPDDVEVKGRHLLLAGKLSNSLKEAGLLHGIIENYSVLGYPLACTEHEISASLELARGVINGG